MTSRRLAHVVLVISFASALALVARISLAEPHSNPHQAPSGSHAAPSSPDAKGHESGHEEGHGQGHGAAHGPEPINWTDLSDKHRPAFIALLVNFGLLAALYYTLGKKPIAESLKQRRVTIGKDIEEARSMLEEAKERAKKYQADLKNADVDAATAKAALITGQGEVEHLLEETEERAERMKRDAERLVEQEKKQLQQDLLIETVNLACAQAQQVLEKTASQQDHERLANELLAELARKPAVARSAGASLRAGGTS